VDSLRPLRGGAASLTLLATIGGGPQRAVVKVAPPGLPPVRNRDVLRQARLLRALSPTAVPVPEVLFEDGGEPPDLPPFFVMSFVEGTSVEPLFDRQPGEVDGAMGARLANAAETMAALHTVDPDALDLGIEPDLGPTDEVDRWCQPLETVDPGLAPGWEAVAADLRDSAPPALPGVLVHGDFRLGNLLADGARIAAVVDWEIWSVGDPRVDVGWFLANADPDTFQRATPYVDALPTLEALTERYLGALGARISDLAWFRALACFKSAATWSLIVKHNRRRAVPDEEVDQLSSVLPHLLERAEQLMHEEP
jgi:aminoglycoside phosphotransferase (APT) family kinase protein